MGASIFESSSWTEVLSRLAAYCFILSSMVLFFFFKDDRDAAGACVVAGLVLMVLSIDVRLGCIEKRLP